MKQKKGNTGKKIVSIVSLIIFLSLMIFLTFYVLEPFFKTLSSPEKFRDYVDSYGIWSRLVFLGVQFLQVFIAFIPGEVVEIGAGYTFGATEGTILCLVGVIIASSLVFILTKTLGIKMVDLFIDREKIENMKLFRDPSKLNNTVFLFFLIPGTPKDLLTYFIGLTKMKLSTFLLLTTIARLPSVISSTVGGKFLNEKDYASAAILFGVTAVVSLGGYILYNLITKKYKAKKEQKNEKNFEG